MAKQAGELFIEGTIDNLTFYKMDSKWYVRAKSSLTGKKFWKSKAFEGSRESCNRFSQGNQLASKIYRMVEKEKKTYALFCFLKKKSIQLLKERKGIEEIETILVDYLRGFELLEKVEMDASLQGKLLNRDPDSKVNYKRFTTLPGRKKLLQKRFKPNKADEGIKQGNTVKQYYLVSLLNVMIMNLSKRFHFRRNENEYRVAYIFTRNKKSDGNWDVNLVLNVSVNENDEKIYEVNKPTATLFLSNDAIEEMVADEAVGFSDIDK